MENIENQEIKTKRELVLSRMKDRNPDKDFENEDVLYGQINDDYDAYDKQIADYKGRESELVGMISADPRAASFLMNWKDGKDPMVSLVSQFGTDIVDAINDPERQEAIAEANKEFVERVAKEKEYEEMYQKNLDDSLTVLEQLQAETGISDEEVDKIMEFIVTIVKDGVLGKFSKETIEMARKALNHDADVSNAAHVGEVKGRNEKIEEKLRKKNNVDGTAALGSKNGSARKPSMPNYGALDKYGENDDIWSRGEEKRTKGNR